MSIAEDPRLISAAIVGWLAVCSMLVGVGLRRLAVYVVVVPPLTLAIGLLLLVVLRRALSGAGGATVSDGMGLAAVAAFQLIFAVMALVIVCAVIWALIWYKSTFRRHPTSRRFIAFAVVGFVYVGWNAGAIAIDVNPGVPRLVRQLLDPAPHDYKYYEDITNHLRQYDRSLVIRELVAALQEASPPDWRQQYAAKGLVKAFDLLALMGATESIPELRRWIDEERGGPVTDRALYSLARLGDAESIDAIVRLLNQRKQDWQAAQPMALALSHYDQPEAKQALRRLVHPQADPRVALGVATLLARAGDGRIRDLITPLLILEDPAWQNVRPQLQSLLE